MYHFISITLILFTALSTSANTELSSSVDDSGCPLLTYRHEADAKCRCGTTLNGKVECKILNVLSASDGAIQVSCCVIPSIDCDLHFGYSLPPQYTASSLECICADGTNIRWPRRVILLRVTFRNGTTTAIEGRNGISRFN